MSHKFPQKLNNTDEKWCFKGGLVILPLTNQVMLSDKEIFLTAKEYALLKLMVENISHVFTKKEHKNVRNSSDAETICLTNGSRTCKVE